jgi:uncharacterized membrane protein
MKTMKIIRSAFEARWFLLVLTIFLCAMAGFMSVVKGMEAAAPSVDDLQRSLEAQAKIRTLVRGKLGEAIAENMSATDEMRLATAEFASAPLATSEGDADISRRIPTGGQCDVAGRRGV